MSITPLQTRESVGRGGEHGGESSAASSATAALRAGEPAGELPNDKADSGRGEEPLTSSASNASPRGSSASPDENDIALAC
jgi:hypothetical protein